MDISKNPNRCLVEDQDSCAAILELIRHHIPGAFPTGGKGAAVYLQVESNIHDTLKPPTLRAEMNQTGRRSLGIVIDAETNGIERAWPMIRRFAQNADPAFIEIPNEMPPQGLIVSDVNGRKLGLWIMPNNDAQGMIEDFLQELIPDRAKPLLDLCKVHVDRVRAGNPNLCREVHLSKAYIHSWLAIQDPPGERLGTAIAKQFLDAGSDRAAPFINWFRRLYGI